ncbi:hypothetical protein AEM51_01785 [Bacteroidetes bacterium UKL13-3]|nr:hypothetical protein AEM51_01785 [Bacteroidetes bacterium UKL13-3]HCP94026.1 hypothetical protein [Bacteroidota bacterium]
MKLNSNINVKQSLAILLLCLCAVLMPLVGRGQVTIFSENMGTPSGTTAIASNTFQNSSTLSYSGTADIRNTTSSTGYTGASGNGNVFITNAINRDFVISGINTSGYTSLALSVGHYKSTNASSNELAIEVSSDGTNYTALSYSRATGTGTVNWILIMPTGTIPSTNNLRIRFRNTSVTQSFRIDDVILTGVLPACTAPTTQATSFTSNAITTTTANIAVTRGDGNNVLIIGRDGTAVSTNPSSGTIYTASQTFGSGDAIGSGRVVYNNSGAGANAPTGNIAITGLSFGTTYHFATYEYNTTGTCYSTTSPAIGSFTTLCATPTTNTPLTVGSKSFTATWGAVTGAISYSLDYSTVSDLSSGITTIDGIVGTSQVITGLTYNTQYYFRVRAINAASVSTPNSNISTTTTLTAATSLVLVGVPAAGFVDTYLPSFTVEARRANSTIDDAYTSTITIAKVSGSGNIGGTLNATSVNGIAIFDEVSFDATDTYSINATDGMLTSSASSNIIISVIPNSSDSIVWANKAAATAWYTNNNWSPITASGAWTSGNIAKFNNLGLATTAGINMGTSFLSIAAIEITSLRTRNLSIGNSATTSGALTLNGAYINNLANVIIRNNSGSILTIQDNETGSGKIMGLVLGNTTDNKIVIDGTGGVTISSIISGSNSLTKQGSGSGILTLSGSNTYTGKTTINTGFIACSGESAFGANPGAFVANQITLNGGGIQTTGAINFSSNRGLTLGANGGIFNTASHNITLQNVVTGSGSLTKTGTSTLILSGSHTYTGSTIVLAGTLQLNNSSGTSMPATNNITISGGTLKVSANQTLNNIELNSGTLTVDAGVTLTINGTLTFTSGATINGLGTIVYGANAKLIYTGSSMQTTSSLEWPATNGPATVTVGSNGITLHANRAVTVELVLNGKLVIGSNTLTLAGILTGNGTLQGGNSSNITITGTGALGTLKMDQTSTVTSSVGVLVINRLSAGSVTIGDTLIVLESINIQNGTLQTGGKLKLASSLNKTAIIPAITGTGAISGNIQMQQFVKSSARRWRFISSPFTNATFEDLQQEIYITGAGNGSTLGTLNSNGFDATTSNRPSVYWYNESVAGDQKNGWVPLTNNTSSLANQPIVLGKGYRVFIRGDRSDIGRLSGATNNQNAVTLNLTGTIYTGDFNFNSLLTYTSTGSTGDGWNLLANPYPCGYDWKAFVLDGTNLSNIDPIIWIYDANSGGYKSYNANSGGTLKDGIIPPGASFWAKANAASPTMIFKESFKVTTEPDQLFKKSESDKLMLKLVFDSVTSDIFMLAHHNASLPTADVYDIRNMNGTITMMSKGTDGVELTYDARPLKVSNDTVQLWVSGGNSTYTILVNDVPTHGKFYYLKDKKLGESHLLSSGMVYNYSTLNSDSTTFGNRFELIISSSESLPVTYHYFKASIFNQHSLLEWGTASEINSHYFSIERSIDGTQWKEIGTRAAQGFSVTKHAYSYLDDAPVQGNINYYRLKQIDRNKQVTYSSIQLVNFIVNDVYSKVLLSPNPATSLFNIQSLVPIRCVTVMDMHGKVLLTSNAAEINIEDLVIGPYIVSIILADGKVITQKLHKR